MNINSSFGPFVQKKKLVIVKLENAGKKLGSVLRILSIIDTVRERVSPPAGPLNTYN